MPLCQLLARAHRCTAAGGGCLQCGLTRGDEQRRSFLPLTTLFTSANFGIVTDDIWFHRSTVHCRKQYMGGHLSCSTFLTSTYHSIVNHYIWLQKRTSHFSQQCEGSLPLSTFLTCIVALWRIMFGSRRAGRMATSNARAFLPSGTLLTNADCCCEADDGYL